jgi:uncharacterized membrane protein YqaE (UPF0057 family)
MTASGMAFASRFSTIPRHESKPMAVTATDVVKIVLAVLLPPLGVFLEVGLTGQFWLNVVLTLLGFLPGVIHALYVIIKF